MGRIHKNRIPFSPLSRVNFAPFVAETNFILGDAAGVWYPCRRCVFLFYKEKDDDFQKGLA